MVIRGRFQNGVIVPDKPVNLPDGTKVKIEVIESDQQTAERRRGGMWNGRVVVSEDFDSLPPDLANAFGIGITNSPWFMRD